MPTFVVRLGAAICVTGINGLIGSHIVDQLLKRGYNVRGAVRGAERHKYLTEYFNYEFEEVRFGLVDVPDMTVEGCYDDVVDGKSSSDSL
jgi:uncharacterized protein YbjT (DUF2867 family)